MRAIRCTLYILLILYWLLICYLTHVPKLPPRLRHVPDKTAHFLAYGALAGLVYVVLWTLRPRSWLIPIAVLCVTMIYGALDEWTQPFFGRTCDLYDWVADQKGALIAVAGLALLQWLALRAFGHKLSPRPRPSLP